jgi:hypothetical protein
LPGALGDGQNLLRGHQALFLQSCIVMRTLGAVAAVYAATASLHTEQRAKLDFDFRPEFQKYAEAFLDQIKEGTVIDLLEFF